MPIYEYECGGCGERAEFMQKFSDGPKRKCPACGKARLRRLVSAAAFHLKGSGWYVTDFRDKAKAGKDGEAKADAAAAKADGTDGASETRADAKTESKATEASQAKSPEKSSDKAPGKPAEKSPAKSSGKPTGKSAAANSS